MVAADIPTAQSVAAVAAITIFPLLIDILLFKSRFYHVTLVTYTIIISYPCKNFHRGRIKHLTNIAVFFCAKLTFYQSSKVRTRSTAPNSSATLREASICSCGITSTTDMIISALPVFTQSLVKLRRALKASGKRGRVTSM